MIDGKLVRVITQDGLELAGFYSPGKSDMVVLHFHGTSGDFYTHKFIDTEAIELQKQGIGFLTANNRGHDVYADIRKHVGDKVEWTQIGGGFEKFEDCILDISAWLDFLTEQGINKVILQGHSLSQKNLYYQQIKKDSRVIGQIHLSPQNDSGLMYYALGSEEFAKTDQLIQQKIEAGLTKEVLPAKLSPVSYVTSVQMYAGYLTQKGPGNLTPYHTPDDPQWQMLEDTTDPLLFVYGGEDVYMKPSVDEAIAQIKRHAKSTKSLTVAKIAGATHSYLDKEIELISAIQSWVTNLIESKGKKS